MSFLHVAEDGQEISLLAQGVGSDEQKPHAPEEKAKSNFVPSLANFSVQYNFTSASVAVGIVGSDQYLGHPLTVEPGWAGSLTLATVFIGASLGMLLMGRLGDVLGRSRAMQVTLAFAMLGAVMPACAVGSPDAFYIIITLGRLLLGVGVGGVYPLSAVSSAESGGNPMKKSLKVALAFFWQSVGVLAVYVLAVIMFAIPPVQPPQEWVPQLEFRVLFALGAIPAGIVFVASCWEEDSAEFKTGASKRQQQGTLEVLRQEPRRTWFTLVGTAGMWFLYDVAYYGTAIFTPMILRSIFGKQDLFQNAWQSAVVASMGLPGCVLAIVLVSRIGSKRLNVYGFAALTVCFAVLAAIWMTPDSDSKAPMLFGVFCVTTFFLNFGPNLGSYVLPAVAFPAHIRSTCHGISSTGGKLGAMVGAFLFPLIANEKDGTAISGVPIVMWIQAVICLLGGIVSQVFLDHDWVYIKEQEAARNSARSEVEFADSVVRSQEHLPASQSA